MLWQRYVASAAMDVQRTYVKTQIGYYSGSFDTHTIVRRKEILLRTRYRALDFLCFVNLVRLLSIA